MALSAYGNVKAVVVVPHLQNPLGSIMSDERKAALVSICARYGVAIIEDEPYRELVEAVAARPIKAWDREGNVIYCPSLNKVLAPGLRLGWMAAGKWASRIKMLKFTQSRHNEILPQLVAAEFLASGGFDRHLFQFRERLRAQREAAADAIARYFPEGTRLSPPEGGLLLWVALPEGVRAERLFEAALAVGIRIAPGAIFSNAGQFDSFIRISCPRPFDREMDDALRRLGALVGSRLQ